MKTISSVLPFVIVAWGAGIYALVALDKWDSELREDLQAISEDRSTIHDYELTKKYVQRVAGDQDDYWIVLSGPTEESFSLTHDEWDATRTGQVFEGHQVNGRVVIPDLQERSPNAKWIMSGFCFILGAVPLVIVALAKLCGHLRAINTRWPGASQSCRTI